MIQKRAGIIIGIVAAAVIIALILPFSTLPSQSNVSRDHSVNSSTIGPTIPPTETTLVCDTPPGRPVYTLGNSDKTRTHQFHVIVQDISNRTLSEESFHLGPEESYASTFMTATLTSTPYYLTFIIDGNATYSQTIYDSATDDYSFEYNPSNKDRLTYFPWMTDYGCRPVTPTP